MSMLSVMAGALAVPAGGGGGGSISVVDTYSGTKLSTNSETVTFSPALEEDDVVVVIRAADSVTAPMSSRNTPGYTEIAYAVTGTFPGFWVEYKVMGASPDADVDIENIIGSAAQTNAYIVVILRGVDASNVLDVTTQKNENAGSGTTVTPGDITTVTDGALVMAIGFLDDDGASTVSTFPSGYTDTADQGTGGGSGAVIGVAFKEIATAGLESPGDFVFSSSDANCWVTAAFRPA